MNLKASIGRLLGIHEPEGTLLTLTLDVAGSGILPSETRVFLKDRLRSLSSEGSPENLRAAARIQGYVDADLRPESDGLYLVAGPDHWDAIELRVPLPNYLHIGSEPYLAPLLAAVQESPRAYVISSSERDATLHVVEQGVWSDLGRWDAMALDRDTERILSGRSPGGRSGVQHARAGIGGGKRDRFEQALEAETARMLGELIRRATADHAHSPAAALYYFGDHEHYPQVHRLLPKALQDRAEDLGSAPRTEPATREAVAEALKRRIAERREAVIQEFRERRSQGHLVALGPSDVLAHRTSGKLNRVFVDPLDPVMGTKCLSCEALHAAPDALCAYCGGMTRPASLTQAIVSHALTHPPLPVTFVPGPAPWLRDLGGMAGLLSQKGIRGKR